MIRSVLAVVAGFLVMALLVTVSTALAVRFVMHKPLASLRSPTLEPLSAAYLATNLGTSALAALLGGYTTAVIARHAPIAHGVALAVLMVLMSLVSMRQAGDTQPRWYQWVLMTLMPALALCGAALSGLLEF